MKFQSLKSYLEDNGCSIDHCEGISYFVSNVINGEICILEEKSDYSDINLIHLFRTLKVSPPKYLRDNYYAFIKQQKAFNKH